MKGGYSRKSVLTGLASFLIVLFTMPLGHALMICMEHALSSVALHYAAFSMGAVGLVMVIVGVFAKGDTRQTFLIRLLGNVQVDLSFQHQERMRFLYLSSKSLFP